MIYLIDNQLPVGLAGHLQAHGVDALHVADCGLDLARDQEIWSYAKANSCVIESKDEDSSFVRNRFKRSALDMGPLGQLS